MSKMDISEFFCLQNFISFLFWNLELVKASFHGASRRSFVHHIVHETVKQPITHIEILLIELKQAGQQTISNAFLFAMMTFNFLI
jgi:hypothetical protein